MINAKTAARLNAVNWIEYCVTNSLNITPISMNAMKKKSTGGAISWYRLTSPRLIDCRFMPALFQQARAENNSVGRGSVARECEDRADFGANVRRVHDVGDNRDRVGAGGESFRNAHFGDSA